MIVDAMQKLNTTNSIKEVSAYLKDTYDLENFEKYYKEVLPHLKATQTNILARKSTSDSTMLDLITMMANAGISKQSSSYEYVKEVAHIFNGENHADPETILPKLDELKEHVTEDKTLSQSDKSALLGLTDMLHNNYEGLVHMIEGSDHHVGESANGRTQCFFCSAWRVIRSVVVTVVAVAIVTAAIAVSAFGPLAFIPGLIVGAVIGGAWSIYDAIANDTCYYAMNCGTDDSEAAGIQRCSSGACILE
jgi:hypothetical protein